MSDIDNKKNKEELHCSFCGKSQHKVKKIIAGPTLFICNECVELCAEIINEEKLSSELISQDKKSLTPKELCDVLDEYVIGGIKTTIELHKHLVDDPDMRKGDYDIHWLEKRLKQDW